MTTRRRGKRLRQTAAARRTAARPVFPARLVDERPGRTARTAATRVQDGKTAVEGFDRKGAARLSARAAPRLVFEPLAEEGRQKRHERDAQDEYEREQLAAAAAPEEPRHEKAEQRRQRREDHHQPGAGRERPAGGGGACRRRQD